MTFMAQPCELTKLGAKTALVFAIIWFGFAAMARAANEPLFLGIIEQSPTHYVGEVSTTPFMVRAAFYRKGNTWKAFPSMEATQEGLKRDILVFPERVDWTIAFDGKNRGQFHTTRPPEWKYYADIGFLQPDPTERVHLIPNGPRGFEYWEHTEYRPLVVVSKPNFADPDRWKEADAPPEVVHRLIPFFRKEIKSAPLSCSGKTTDYGDKLIRGRKSYLSASGARLVQLALDDSAVRDCDGPRDDAYDSRWFYVDDNKNRFLGQSLELVDAGDYDNDGHSDVVFHKYGYNFDGYVLFYDQLQKEADFSWSYH